MPGDEEKALEDLKKLQEAEAEEGTETVEVEEPEEEEAQEATPRQAARRERASKFKAEQEGRAAAERERDDLRVRLAAAEAAQRYAPQSPKDEPKPDPADKEIESITSEIQELQDQYAQLTSLAEKANQAIDPKVIASFRTKYSRLTTTMNEKIAERVQRRNSATQQPQGPTTEQAAAVAALKMRYADVDSHQDAKRIAAWASGQWQSHLAAGGSNSIEQMDRIMDEARRKFGLAKSPPPSAATKARYAGAGAGATAANGDANGDAVKSFKITPRMKDQAMAAYPDLPEKKAIQKFIQVQIKRGVKTA